MNWMKNGKIISLNLDFYSSNVHYHRDKLFPVSVVASLFGRKFKTFFQHLKWINSVTELLWDVMRNFSVVVQQCSQQPSQHVYASMSAGNGNTDHRKVIAIYNPVEQQIHFHQFMFMNWWTLFVLSVRLQGRRIKPGYSGDVHLAAWGYFENPANLLCIYSLREYSGVCQCNLGLDLRLHQCLRFRTRHLNFQCFCSPAPCWVFRLPTSECFSRLIDYGFYHVQLLQW